MRHGPEVRVRTHLSQAAPKLLARHLVAGDAPPPWARSQHVDCINIVTCCSSKARSTSATKHSCQARASKRPLVPLYSQATAPAPLLFQTGCPFASMPVIHITISNIHYIILHTEPHPASQSGGTTLEQFEAPGQALRTIPKHKLSTQKRRRDRL